MAKKKQTKSQKVVKTWKKKVKKLKVPKDSAFGTGEMI